MSNAHTALDDWNIVLRPIVFCVENHLEQQAVTNFFAEHIEEKKITKRTEPKIFFISCYGGVVHADLYLLNKNNIHFVIWQLELIICCLI